MSGRHLIDTPSPFADLKEWQDYLAELESLKPLDDQVKRLIEEAREQIKSIVSKP